MRLLNFTAGLTLLAVTICSIRYSHAEIVFETDLRANFDINIVPGTILGDVADAGSIPTGQYISMVAFGPLTFVLDDTDPTATSMNFVDVSGRLEGVGIPYFISPVDFVSGSLTDIQRDAEGNITDGFVNDLNMVWILRLGEGTAQELTIQSENPLRFDGMVSGIPFIDGSTIAGPTSPFTENGMLVNPDGSLGPTQFTMQNRTLTAVPEPSTASLLGIFAFGLSTYRVRRATNTTFAPKVIRS